MTTQNRHQLFHFAIAPGKRFGRTIPNTVNQIQLTDVFDKAAFAVGYEEWFFSGFDKCRRIETRTARMKCLKFIDRRRCRQRGMIDVTDIEGVKEGDEVVIFSSAKGNTLEDMAEALGTIPYEIMTSVSARVKRIYVRE